MLLHDCDFLFRDYQKGYKSTTKNIIHINKSLIIKIQKIFQLKQEQKMK